MFSVITPTYNREDTLFRVYDSLRSQTFREFHWVIIDDASSDDTESLVNSWINNDNNGFKIEYYKLEKNKGKPFALNYGLKYCKEAFTIIADSDDSFENTTLEDLKAIWNLVDSTKDAAKIAAVWTLVKDQDGNLVGDLFPSNFWQVSFNQRVLKSKKKVQGEKWHSWRTVILQNYKFYHNDNTIHIGESATWTKINKDFDFLCLNLVHRTYYDTSDGLINQKKSNKKRAKIKYYTSFFQLCDTKTYKIIQNKYYRQLAFDHIRSSMLYHDSEFKLKWTKKIVCIFSFISITFQKIIDRSI